MILTCSLNRTNHYSLSTIVLNSRDFQVKLWLPKKRIPINELTITKTVHKCMYWYNLTKAKTRFKKPKDTSGVELLDFENF